MASARLMKLTAVLSGTLLLVAAMSFLVPNDDKQVFGWAALCVPVLWVLWVVCALSRQVQVGPTKLIWTWLAIDISILALLISASITEQNLGRSQGTDAVLAIYYLPVGAPLLALVSLLPEQVRDVGAGLGNVIEIFFAPGPFRILSAWLPMSLLAAIQSVVIVVLSRLAYRWFDRATLTRNERPVNDRGS